MEVKKAFVTLAQFTLCTVVRVQCGRQMPAFSVNLADSLIPTICSNSSINVQTINNLLKNMITNYIKASGFVNVKYT